jgi:outer membrane receptor protein involved in Fe transport
VGARWRPIDAIAIRTAWTWLDTEILGVDGAESEAPRPYQVGDQLIRRPRHQLSFEAGWFHTRGSAFVLLNGRGTVRDIEPNFAAEVFDNPGYVTIAIGGALRLTRNIQVFTRVTNLFDREYEETYGFPALGRMGMIGLRVTGHR